MDSYTSLCIIIKCHETVLSSIHWSVLLKMLDPLLGVLGSCGVVLASFGITKHIPGLFLTLPIPKNKIKTYLGSNILKLKYFQFCQRCWSHC